MPWGEKNHTLYEKNKISMAIINKKLYICLCFKTKKIKVEHILNLAPVLWNIVKIDENRQKLKLQRTGARLSIYSIELKKKIFSIYMMGHLNNSIFLQKWSALNWIYIHNMYLRIVTTQPYSLVRYKSGIIVNCIKMETTINKVSCILKEDCFSWKECS